MYNNIENYNIIDRYEEVELGNTNSYSDRAVSLIARNRNKPSLKTGIVNIVGATDMLAGMEYHYGSFMYLCSRGAEGNFVEDKHLDHEAVAYLNRMGQFYHFSDSAFVKEAIGAPDVLIPTIVKFLVFRNKHGAHRSIDKPRHEEQHTKGLQAGSLSVSIGGRRRQRKSGVPDIEFPTEAHASSWARFQLDLWEHSYVIYTITDGQFYVNFTPETDHSMIMREAYGLLERVVLHE
jgi:hypothetical protein